jgi:hypothetical protein
MENILKYLNDNKFDEIIKIKDYENFKRDGNNILHLLSIRGNEKGMDFFLKENSELNKSNIDGSNIIHLLFKNGWDDLAEKYYKKFSDLLYLFDKDINLPLLDCIDRFDTFIKCFNFMKSEKNKNIIEILNNVSYHNDNLFINLIKISKNNDNYYKFITKNIELIDFDKPKMSPILIYSIQNNKNELSKYFIKNKKGIDSKNYLYLLPINIACIKNNIEIVKLLLNENNDISYGGFNNEYFPLNIAINNDFIDLGLILSDYVTNYNTFDRYKNTYMHYIADKLITYLENNNKDNEKKLKQILKKIIYKINIDTPNNDGLTARKILLSYIKLKKKLKTKDSDTKILINTVNSIEEIKKIKENDVNIIQNKKKYVSGLFNSDIFHNMLYCMYLLNKYNDLGIPHYKFNKNEYFENITNFEMQNISYNKYYKIIYDILNIGNRFLYPLIPSVILWRDKDLHYINTDLFKLIKNLSKEKRFIMIKISLIVGGQYTHANVILIDLKDSSIRRFEPYGISDVGDEYHLDHIILENVSNVLNKKMKYYKPNDYLNLSKFQLVSNDSNNEYRKTGDPGGYCLAWCIWYIELKINNADITEEELITNASEKIIKHYKNTDNPYLYFIRDYSRKLNDEKDKILKKLKFKNIELYDMNYKVTNLEKVLNYMINFFK